MLFQGSISMFWRPGASYRSMAVFNQANSLDYSSEMEIDTILLITNYMFSNILS